MPTSKVMALPFPPTTNAVNIPGDLAALAAAVELDVVMRFASQADRTARLAGLSGGLTVKPGMVSYRADADTYERLQGGTWVDLVPPAESFAAAAPTGPVALSAGRLGLCSVNIPPRPFPRLLHVGFGALMTLQASANDEADVVIRQDGNNLPRAARLGQVGQSATGTVNVSLPAGSATTLASLLQKATGTGSVTVTNNSFFTYLEILAVPA